MLDPRIDTIRSALSTHIRGKAEAIDSVITCLLADGHILIEDVPGVGKTTLAYALAQAIDCEFTRIQFTSDLIPSDIIGVSVYQKDHERFQFHPGPIFANVVLADEINRSSPKTQSALLEAMERGLVTVDGQSRPIPQPFMVLATQNPVDFESTFPLPNAQLDRFLMRISMGYPDANSEKELLQSGARHYDQISLEHVASKSDIEELRQKANEVFVEDATLDYLHELVTKTRSHPAIEVGVSPRGALAFKAAIQAVALLDGRDFATPLDAQKLAVPCLAHRLRLRESIGFESDWETASRLVSEIVTSTELPHRKD